MLIGLAIGVTALTGCGNKTDANEKNFGAAISQFYEKNGGLCLFGTIMGPVQWPVYIKTYSMNSGKEMAALESVGLVLASDAEIEDDSLLIRRKVKVKRYALTDSGKKFYRQKDGNICYGKLALDKIVKWDVPTQAAPVTSISSTYKIRDQAEWSKNAAILAAFPIVKRRIDGVGQQEETRILKLTNVGWEVIDYGFGG